MILDFSLFKWQHFYLSGQKLTASHLSTRFLSQYETIYLSFCLFYLFFRKSNHDPFITQKASLFSRQFYPTSSQDYKLLHISVHPLALLGFITIYIKRNSCNLMVSLECDQPNIQLFRLQDQWCGQIYHTVQKSLKLELKLDLEYGITRQLALESDEILSTQGFNSFANNYCHFYVNNAMHMRRVSPKRVKVAPSAPFFTPCSTIRLLFRQFLAC